MRRQVSFLSLCLLAIVAALVTPPVRTAPPAPRDGQIRVYLLPMPGDASRLSFDFVKISALAFDGRTVPLDLLVNTVPGDVPEKIRELTTATLPPGQYKGLAIEVADARLEREDGPATLALPEEPVFVDVPFRVLKRAAVVLEMRLVFKGSITDDFRFDPVLVAEPAMRPAVGVLGLATRRADESVTIFDKAAGRLAGVIPVDGPPVGLALDPQRQRAYVSIPDEDSLVAIGLLEFAVINRNRTRGGDAPAELALTPDGEILVAANSGSRTVSLIDPLSLTEIDRIEVGDAPRAVIVGPDGRRAYVFNTAAASVSVIDIPGRRLVGTVSTDAGPFRGQLDREGKTLYTIHRSSLNVSLIDTENLVVKSKTFVGPGALELTVDTETNLIYLSRRGSGEIEIFDASSLLPVASIPVEGDVTLMTIDHEMNFLYTLLPALGEVHGFSLSGNKLRVRAGVGDDPFWIAINGER